MNWSSIIISTILRTAGCILSMAFRKAEAGCGSGGSWQKKGVAADVIEIAFEELEEIPDEFETAYSIAESIVRGIDPKELEFAEKRKLEGKIGRRLAGRGFSMDTIHKVVSRILY